MMKLTHLTSDAPRQPLQISAGQRVCIYVVSEPVALGQSVWVSWTARELGGAVLHGSAKGFWLHNEGDRSFWCVEIGPFAARTRVKYTVVGEEMPGKVLTGPSASFEVDVAPTLPPPTLRPARAGAFANVSAPPRQRSAGGARSRAVRRIAE